MINRNFFMLLAGQSVSQVGDKFHMIALSFWVLSTTGSSAKMGAVLAASLVPSLLFGFFSGAFVDRYNRKYIIVGTDLIRGGIIGLFAVLFYFGMMNFYLVLVMQVLLSICAAFFDPAIPSVIPQIVEEKMLGRANSRHQFVNGFSTISGAFLGGIFVSIFGYFWIFVINAVSFILSALLESFIHIPLATEDSIKGGSASTATKTAVIKQQGILTDMKQGYHYIFSNGLLKILLFQVLVIHFFVGSIEVFMPVIANTISLEGAKILGFFQAALGIGTLVSAVLIGMINIGGKEISWLFRSVFCIGGLYVCASFFPLGHALALYCFLAMIFLFGCSIMVAGISFRTLLQKNVKNRFSGRVFAVAGSVGNAAIPGAMIFYGFLLEIVREQTLLLYSGLILLLVSLMSYISAVKKKGKK